MANNLKKISALTSINANIINGNDLLYYVSAISGNYTSYGVELGKLFGGDGGGTNNLISDIRFSDDSLYIQTGYVGINKSPIVPFDVSGESAFDGNMTIDGNVDINGSTETIGLTVTGTSGLNILNVSSNATISGNTNVNIIHSTKSDKKLSFLEIINVIYPIGTLYTTIIATNPGTTFGVGTWEVYGEGKVLVGKSSSGTFATAGSIGGVESVTLTSAQSGVPAHGHPASDSGHAHPYVDTYYSESGPNYGQQGSADTDYDNSDKNHYRTTSEGYANITVSNNTTQNASQAHTNLQPYVVVYMWKRTS
jgi:microcystin-dependent protein